MHGGVRELGTEQARLKDLLSRAEAGAGGALLVVGEPGVGKTELFAYARQLAGDSFTVLTLAGTAAHSGFPFAGLADLIKPVIERLEVLPASQAEPLRNVTDLSDARGPERQAICLATFDLLAAAARERPILVIADNLQWLDEDSRHVIRYLASQVESIPVAVLAASSGEMLAMVESAGYEPRSRRQPSGWDELTAAEQRVAQLIIDGATYREAAQELFLSVRTVESHLRQVYRKLGLRSRTELTRALSREPRNE